MAKRVLVLCTGNSCRSQMAEGYLRLLNPAMEIRSAGIAVHGVNPLAVKVMAEDGVDISSQTSNNVDEYAGTPFDVVITVCDHANEVCPVFPYEAIRLHQNFIDPSRQTGRDDDVLPGYRQTRDAIKAYIQRISEAGFVL
ncbi:MAG: arsenate reductase ArsC [Bacteroidetes bacterium]|nr:MAG: arsenate reductase ArsC [Bacteroidota bacterium]